MRSLLMMIKKVVLIIIMKLVMMVMIEVVVKDMDMMMLAMFTFLQWHTIISTALFDISGLFLVVVLIYQLTGRMNLYCNYLFTYISVFVFVKACI